MCVFARVILLIYDNHGTRYIVHLGTSYTLFIFNLIVFNDVVLV